MGGVERRGEDVGSGAKIMADGGRGRAQGGGQGRAGGEVGDWDLWRQG